MAITEVVIKTVPITYEGCTDNSSEVTEPNSCPDTPRYFAFGYFDVGYFSPAYFTVCNPNS